MSSLAIFPIEILECITGMVVTSQQVRLWQCGDRILNIKLKNGGLKRTSLCWPAASWMPWPSWYFTTHDSIVDVEWGVDIGKSLCPTLELTLLPKTLKRLHLHCDDVFVLLLQQNIKMNDTLPSLQSLYLSGDRLREENLKNLPSNLIELSVASSCRVYSSRLFSDLPRHITSLTLEFPIDERGLQDDLPSQLSSLRVHSFRCDFEWFSTLPRSLKLLEAFCSGFHPDWLALPRELEELNLELYWSTGILKSTLPQLPQSLKTLVLREIQDLTAEDELGPLLPKNLTRFVLAQGIINHSGLQKLPASLTDFDVSVSLTHPDILSFYRPETRKMRIKRGKFSGNLNLFPFPTKLLSLELEHINDDLCAMLPPGLQVLKIVEEGLITTKGASKLPKSLTSLTAPLEIFSDNETMSYLRHISELDLKAGNYAPSGNLDENWIYSLLPSPSATSSNHDISSTVTNINGVNDRLTSLTVRVHGDDDEYRNIFTFNRDTLLKALLKFINLKKLHLTYPGDASSDCLCFIPQTVTNLNIDIMTHPNATQLSMLPKCLRYLNLQMDSKIGREFELDDEAIQSLPRSLQVFRINGSSPNLKSDVHTYLPPNFSTGYWQGEDMDSFFISLSPLDRLYGKRDILFDL